MLGARNTNSKLPSDWVVPLNPSTGSQVSPGRPMLDWSLIVRCPEAPRVPVKVIA